MIKLSTINRVAYIYLVLPFLMFSVGWLNHWAAALVVLLSLIAVANCWQSFHPDRQFLLEKRDLVICLTIIGVWLFLSGIGGYAFQNDDHHSRNAIFRDLITYDWPVVYHFPAEIVAQRGLPELLILSYYFGFWLPAALVGKLFGWTVANLFLFVWTYIGLLLAILLLADRLQQRLWRTALLLIFFSGMDFVGASLFQQVPGNLYPGLWPPVQHLEWWAGSLQFSSFTTDLFWTYNQFVPTLLILALFLVPQNEPFVIFLQGICFFYAPFPAVGLLPFTGISILKWMNSALSQRSVPNAFKNRMLGYWNAANLGGIAFMLISILFFSTNLSGKYRAIDLGSSIPMYLLFVCLEALLLWFLLLPDFRADWNWYIVAVVLVTVPLFRVGGSWDFMMRASVPALLILMVGCGQVLAKARSLTSVRRSLLLGFLLLGALTPLYEMNRSFVRTSLYYGVPYAPLISFNGFFQTPRESGWLRAPELGHPDTLTADSWISISTGLDPAWDTKVGKLFGSGYGILWNNTMIRDGD